MFSSLFLNCPWISDQSLLLRGSAGGKCYKNKSMGLRSFCNWGGGRCQHERVKIIPIPTKTNSIASVYIQHRHAVMSQLPDLPEEILLFIFSYLTKEEILAVGLVCQKLFEIVLREKLNTIELTIGEGDSRREDESSSNVATRKERGQLVKADDILNSKLVCNSVSHFMICRSNFMPFDDKLKKIQNELACHSQRSRRKQWLVAGDGWLVTAFRP